MHVQIDYIQFLVLCMSLGILGFLGISFGGGQRKREAERTAGEARTLRGEIGGFRGQLEGVRTTPRPDVDLLRSTYSGMISDPTKRGFSPEARTGMFARQAEVGAGARTGALQNIQRQAAAGGMTNKIGRASCRERV